MTSTFSGLSTAINALMAQRQALDVAGQNIANVNTPGYTRQRADLQEITSAGRGGLYAVAQEPGWGVSVADVARLADAVAEAQQLTSYWSTQRDQAAALVTDVNTTAKSVADLNQRITTAKLSGGQVNELTDQRDQLVLHLSELTGATVRQSSDGSVDVMVGGSPLVHGPHAEQLTLSGATAAAQATSTPVSFSWVGGGAATVSGGRLAASLQALNTTIPGTLVSYDNVAQTLAGSVNAIHATGQDLDGNPAGAFFTATGTVTAATISVAITDPRQVASAVPAGSANLDGSLADQIAQLATSATGADRTWSTAVAQVGVDSNRAATQATTAATVTTNSDADRDSASGVSLDEELTNMLTFQRAYEGASRLLTALDQNLDTLINRTGIAGRA